MSLRLIKPGLSATDLSGRVHPRTGEPLKPIGYIKGRPIWPIMGAAPDPEDPDDEDFTGGGDDDDDDDDDDDTDEDDGKKPVKKAAKSKKSTKDDDEDDEEELVYTQDDYDRIKNRMRKADQRSSALEEENRKLKAQLAKAGKAKPSKEDDDETPPVVSQEDRDRDARRDRELMEARLENAFLHAARTVTNRSGELIEWQDSEDALAVGTRLGLFEDVLDDDGTVNRRAMARALRELAKRKPHLVKPKKVSDQDDDDDEDDEPEARPPRTRRVNGKRKGQKEETDRAALAKKFPALARQ